MCVCVCVGNLPTFVDTVYPLELFNSVAYLYFALAKYTVPGLVLDLAK